MKTIQFLIGFFSFSSFYLYAIKINGSVVYGSTEKGIPNVKVFAYILSQIGNVEKIESTNTLKNGNFSLEVPEKSFILGSFYNGVFYRTLPLIPEAQNTPPVKITVWDTTKNSKNIKIFRNHIAITLRENNFEVVEVFSFENTENKTYSEPISIPIFPKFSNFTPIAGFFPWEVHLIENVLTYTNGIPPGKTVIAFSYNVPEKKFNIERVFPFFIESFEVFAGENIKVKGFSSPPEIMETPGGKFYIYKMANLQREYPFRVEFKRSVSFHTKILANFLPFILVIFVIFVFILFRSRWKTI